MLCKSKVSPFSNGSHDWQVLTSLPRGFSDLLLVGCAWYRLSMQNLGIDYHMLEVGVFNPKYQK